ncbi:S9 family peptidase [Clostridiaceae bacterium M8S5]|nr:S9 family peptidase [Clostridiaceae bacterium M8S5]
MSSIKIDDFTNYKFLSRVKYSPNGENACFVVHSAEFDENKYNSNIWVYNVNQDKYFQLTALDKESSFVWLDDERIIFPAIRDKKDKEKKEEGDVFTQYYQINISGGEAKKSFRIPKNVGKIIPINSEEYIFTASGKIGEKELYTLDKESKKSELERRKEEKDYEIVDELPFWSNGSGYVNKKRNSLFKYNTNTKKIQKLSNDYMAVEHFELNKDKNKIVFISAEYKSIDNFVNKVYTYDIQATQLEEISTLFKDYSFSFASYINDKEVICFGSTMEKYGLNENGKFYIIDTHTKEARCITPDLDLSLWNSVNSDCRYNNGSDIKFDSGQLYFASADRYDTCLFKIDMKGNIQKIIESNGTVDNFDIVDGNILYIGLRGIKLQELYLHSKEKEKQITDFNNWVLEERTISKPEKIEIESEDGVYIDGWVMKPIGFREDKKYPAILNIHGGPKTVYGKVFVHEMQYWANEGYFVFFCNPRGSDGKGNEFADIRGKYGTIDYEDIMKFTDNVLERYTQIDEERVGVTGGSYGGYMTNWIIGHTNRFKAAASQRSISNWISFFNTSDIGYIFGKDQCAGEPWKNHDELWSQSPLKYADKVETPTLFIHSEEDYRCWLPEGMQMYTALKFHNVDTRMCIFKEENHELSRSGKPKHRIKRLKEITQWFDKYLK